MDPYAQHYQYNMGYVPPPPPPGMQIPPSQHPPGMQAPPFGIQVPPLPPPMGPQVPRPTEGVGPVKYLFVGGFPIGTTQDELLPVLETFGPVEAMRITAGKSCCFVRYAELEDAIAAHDRMHGTMFRGSFLRVGWGRMDLQDDPSQTSRILWVGNIDPMTTEDEIAHLFGVYGQILQVKTLPAKFCSFVSFQSLEDAVRARVALNGFNYKGKPLRINFRKDEIPGHLSAIGSIQLEINSLGQFPSAYIRLEDFPIRQVLPPPPEVKQVIDTFAGYVLKNGQEFEASSKARASARLSFLDPGDPAHEYYRWKVYDGWSLRDRATKLAVSYRNALAIKQKEQERERLQQQQQQNMPPQEFQAQGMLQQGFPAQGMPQQEFQPQVFPQQMNDVMPNEAVKPIEKEVPRIEREGAEQEQKQEQDRQVLPPAQAQKMPQEEKGEKEKQGESGEAPPAEKKPEENVMSGGERETLVEMLGKLEPKKSVIKAVGEWAKKRNGSAREVCDVLWGFFSGLRRGEFERKVSVMYLVSDVTSLDERYRKALEKVVGGIVDGVIQDARGEEDLERVGDLLGLWERSKVFAPGTLKRQMEECEEGFREPEPERKRSRRSRRSSTAK